MRTQLNMAVAIVCTMMVAACGQQAADIDWPATQGEILSCDHYETVNVSSAGVNGILNNNVWNQYAAEKPWRQCLLKRKKGHEFQHGWAWAWPKGSKAIFAQPQIKVGVSPWQPQPATNTQFPAAINKLSTFSLAFDVEAQSSGDFNLAATMWLTREPMLGDKARPEIISAEIMIWPYATEGQSRPAGRQVGRFELADTVWQLWYQQDWGDVAGVNSNRWSYLAFKAEHNALAANIDLHALLRYAAEQGLVDDAHYVSDLELGNEVMGGEGVTWLNRFDVDIVTRP